MRPPAIRANVHAASFEMQSGRIEESETEAAMRLALTAGLSADFARTDRRWVVNGLAMFRQGDVLVISVGSVPSGAQPLPRERGRVVVAYGEATGHAHAIGDSGAALLEHDADRYLRVTATGGVHLTHEEHNTIVLPPGDYRVVRQREYAPEAPRVVAD
jgi:hypothetical protein